MSLGKPQVLQDIDELNKKFNLLLGFVGKLIENNANLSNELKEEFESVKKEIE